MSNQLSGSSSSSKKQQPTSPPIEPRHLPPIKSLPLRKRLAIEASQKVTIKPKEEDEEYPPTPGSHHSSSSNSSDSTIPIVHSPPLPIKQQETKPLKQPLKKAYSWSKAKTNPVITTKKIPFKTGGNPLLWNNGDEAEKYTPWTSTEDTINSFKSAWLGQDEDEEDSEEEEIKVPVSKKPTLNTTSKRGRPSITKPIIVEEPKVRKNSGRSTLEGKLYCTCRKPYDATRFMIACDRCDDWFHGECIGINERESEFIDLYFCLKCSKVTGKKTSWKPKCANPACHKAARIGSQLGHLSKYCSDSCGMQVARARLELVEIKRRNNSQNTTHKTNNIPIAQLALMKQKQLRVNSFADKQDKQRLAQVRIEKQKIRDDVLVTDKKCFFLKQLVSKQQQEGPCGFDSRLLHDEVTQDFTVCSIEKCQKHVDWQIIFSLDFESERNQHLKSLYHLEKERKQIKSRMRTRRNEKEIMKDLMNGTVAI